MSKDYYKILDVNKNATADEIKKAFRKKAHEHHPDKNGGSDAKFKEVNEAYQVLGKPERRKQYDQFGTTFEGMGGQAAYDAGFDWADLFRQGAYKTSGFRTGNINFDFGDLGDIFTDFFGNGFGRSQASYSQRRARGSDIEANLVITLEDAVFGTEKVFDITKDIICESCKGNGVEPGTKIVTCKTCGGSGQVTVSQATFLGAFRSVTTCSDCQGEGKMPEKKCAKCYGQGRTRGKERVKIKIPAGISDGETLRLSGRGAAGVKGASAGDLFINIKVLPHREFTRENDNLLTTKKISFSGAALGDKVRIKTLDGEVNLKIPSGTSSGQQFVIKNKGAHKLRGRGRGDLIVEVKVEVPRDLSRKQRRLLEELRGEGL